jgi:hypothetical protein
MLSVTKRIGLAAVLGLAVLVGAGPRANAQNLQYFQLRPGLTVQQYTHNLAAIGQALQNVPPYAFGFNPYRGGGGFSPYAAALNNQAALYSSPYLGGYANPYNTASLSSYGNGGYGGGYGSYPYYEDPAAGYLRGGAEVINAQGRFMVSQQQAYQMREQYRQAKIDTRRKAFDEYLYEREKTPTPEEERQRAMLQQLNRSRNNPPVTEIWSGKALNDLLADLRKGTKDVASLRNFQVPLDEEGLKHINVSKGTGNVGLLKNEGRLSWPVALSGEEFKPERERVSALAREAVSQAGFNRTVDAGTIRQMMGDVDKLKKELRRTGGDLPVALYIEANTFVNNLNDAIRALQQPDVNDYFGPEGKYVLKAKTVADLVKFMADRGLQFAPAVPGDENAYVALHNSLAVYDRAASTQTAER